MDTQTKTAAQENELLFNCKELTHGILGSGGPITSTVAGTYIKHYLDGVNDNDGTKHNYGYLFGLDSFATFFKQINDYNVAPKNSKLQIEGIRVYIGRKAAMPKGTAGPAIPRENIMDTIFLIPVTSDGKDLYEVRKLQGDEIILGNPRPCPNECLTALSLSFYNYKK
jgi:hypothetical protein